MKKVIIYIILLVLIIIDWFEFHDLFESKTLPEYLTLFVSIPIFIILVKDLIGGEKYGRQK